MDEGDRQASDEALALIASHRGQYSMAAELMSEAPPSGRKAHFLEKAGRVEEAAACLEELASAGAEVNDHVMRLYCRLATEEFAREPACLEAETHLDFSTR